MPAAGDRFGDRRTLPQRARLRRSHPGMLTCSPEIHTAPASGPDALPGQRTPGTGKSDRHRQQAGAPSAGAPVRSAVGTGFALRHWAAWAPGLERREDWLAWAAAPFLPAGDAAPAVAQMPAMLRRRADRLGRMALAVLYESAHPGAPIVYASRYGELGRVARLLEELATSGAVSPQGFSVSVHNAIAGLYSIATRERENIQSLAAAEATPFAGLVDAAGLLAEGAECVRLVLCEEPVPAVFGAFAEPADCPYAVLLELAAGDAFRFEWAGQAAGPASPRLPPALDVLRFLLGDAAESTIVAGRLAGRLTRGR